MGKQKAATRAADKLAATPSKNWLLRLGPEVREEIQEIKRRYRAGDYADKSLQQIVMFIIDEFELSVVPSTVRSWLIKKGGKDGQENTR